MSATHKRIRFFNVCKAVLINIENIIILIFVFVIKYFDHEFLFKRFF